MISESEKSGANDARALGDSASATLGIRAQRLRAQDRTVGLPLDAVTLLQQAVRQIDARHFDHAARALASAMRVAPDHPEIWRLQGVLCYRRGQIPEALAALRRTLAAWPDDALTLATIGSLFADTGHVEPALATFRHACKVAPSLAAAWFNLGKLLETQSFTQEACEALQRAVACEAEHVPARILLAECLNMLGSAEAAAGEFRQALRIDPHASRAWIGLVNLKTVPLVEQELHALQRSYQNPAASAGDRAIIGFALGKVLEDEGRYAEAFSVLTAANAAQRRTMPWDARLYSRGIDMIGSTFARVPTSARHDALGREVIFIVGLPRSGSTLIEQIFAAHPDVEGASELPDLELVIAEESQRRRESFPAWVPRATSEDWQRLGRRYLERTARWRRDRPRFTDKRPENWAFAGAALAMLPNARVIDCRRDAVETCWACFKQLFGPGRLAPAYDLLDMAEYSLSHDRLCDHWAQSHPDRFLVQGYEALLADPDHEIRRLLTFCDLRFDAACLSFHTAGRTIRTVSAAQVRRPLNRNTARAANYGAQLNPLRESLRAADPGSGDMLSTKC